MGHTWTHELRDDLPAPERAYLVGIQSDDVTAAEVQELLLELAELAANLDMSVAGTCHVRLKRPRSRYLVGAGKAEEIALAAGECGADVILFDDALTPSQQRNWERLVNTYVIDRHQVILDIFARRAQTREAVLQIALAQARYALPRLRRRWTHLSRQRGMRGGTGLRGEGEQQIEVDHRLVRRRITHLTAELDRVRSQRRTQRKRRLRKPVPVAAIVGYTNAGKSSLLNALTEAGVLVEDKLFATLDPTVRRLLLPNQQEVLLSDTVGFIRRLPHQLVEAFKATLEEAVLADLVIEVLDMASPQVEEHHHTTQAVLEELGAAGKPTVMVFNKLDAVDNTYLRPRLRRRHPDSIFVSALTGVGIEDLRQCLADELAKSLRPVRLLVPHRRYDVIALLHRTSQILGQKHTDDGILVDAAIPPTVVPAVADFLHFPVESA